MSNKMSLAFLFLFISTFSFGQINYSSLYTSSNFVKTIDLSRPVGVVDGSPGTTPTGGVTYSIPIYAPPGTNGIQPSVSIVYNSQGSTGVVGFGWNIAGLSVISRTGKNIYHNGLVKPVSYTSDDAFLLDGMRLNAITGNNGANGTEYAGEAESFTKIVSNSSGSPDNPDWFLITAKDGSKMEFGNSADSRILTDDGLNVMLWRLNRIIDINGNYIDFKYDNDSRDSRIDEINYTGNINTGLLTYNKIKFTYGYRNETNLGYDGGASLSVAYLLNKIIVTHLNDDILETVKTYEFNYGYDNVHSLLKEVVEKGASSENEPALNSTIFLYGDQPQNIAVQSTAPFIGECLSGDFNADGKTDILACTYYNENSIKYNNGYKILLDPQSSTFHYEKQLTPGHSILENKKLVNFLAGDYNMDGRDDVFLAKTSVVTYPSGNVVRYLNRSMVIYTTNSGGLESELPIGSNFNSFSIHPSGNFLIQGDFDGDGNQDIITILGSTGTYSGSFSSPSKFIFNKKIWEFTVAAPDYSALSIAEAKHLIPMDFDGDGKQEIWVTYGALSYILSIGPDPVSNGVDYRATPLVSLIHITGYHKLFPSDFNGDRKTDLLVKDPSGNWKIYLSTGKDLVETSFSFNQSVNLEGNDKIVAADFNGDGKTDILHAFPVWVNGVSTTSKFSLYFSKGFLTTGSFFYEQCDYNTTLPNNDLVSGDFNGDGRSDLLLKGYYPYSTGDIIYFKPNGKERLLMKVTDGHNVTTSFDYKNMTDKSSWPYVYNRTIALDDPANLSPFNYVQLPVPVVSSMTVPDGIGGDNTTSFYYENAVVHRHVKGFLGFKKVSTINITSGVGTITENEINTQYAIPYNVKQTMISQPGLNVISETFVTNSFANLSTGTHDIRYFQKVDKTLSIDHLSGAASESDNTFDSYGNITTNVSTVGVLVGSTINPTETTSTATIYSIHNTPVPAKPDQVTVTNIRTGMPAKSSTTTITYTTNGLPASQTVFSGLPKAVTTNYSYNAFGNATQIVTSASGLSNRTAVVTFDSKGRYPVTKQMVGSTVTQTESFTYDGKWGKPLTQKSIDCLTTTFEYDAFGRLRKTYLPEGYDVNTTLHWAVLGEQLFYTFTDFPGGKPDSKTWVDKAGREIKTQVRGFNGQWLTQLTTYDYRGNVESKTNSYYPNETPLMTTTWYDAYNRPVTVSNALTTINTTYSSAVPGQMKVTTLNSAGQSSSKTTDASGKVISAIDNGGQLDYTYDSRGNQVQVAHNSTVLVTSVYDEYGRQTKLTDNNAGETNYEYDAYGQLVQQIDALLNIYNMGYDDFGRMVSRNGPEGTTSYEYYAGIAIKCKGHKLKKITGFNGVIKEYTYDNLKRLQSETVTVDGTTYTTSYNYDPYNNLSSTTYPTGMVISNAFDENGGLLTSGYNYNHAGYYNLFTANAVNGFGQYTSYTLGNGLTTQNEYQYGIPTRSYTPGNWYFPNGVQDNSYTFDFNTGNLLSRSDAINSQVETFQYDPLNRLTTSTVNGVQQLNINYDGTASFSMGNIASKTDAGNYVYYDGSNGINKIHAVANITNPAGATAPPISIPSTGQYISYTPFLKTAIISEGNKQLEFTYGPDYERVKTELGNTTVYEPETRLFLGNYEHQVKLGQWWNDIHYVHAGNGLVAMVVVENGIANPYYVYSDHLGSPQVITNHNATQGWRQNFDAWGRHRDPANWNTYLPATATPNVPNWLYRGYTGHEHLPDFALINMNGRMYDPIQGRMLSPDNYVPDPWHTQGYNRYSYANNNPLTYTDPDGNLFWFAIGAAALIGGFMKGVAYDQQGKSFLGGFWRGAIVGAASAALAGVGSGTFLANVAWGVGQGIGINGLSNILDGNAFFQGAVSAGIIGGAFAAITSGIESYKNMQDGYKFGTNDGRVKNMIKNKEYNNAIEFLRKRFGMTEAEWTTRYSETLLDPNASAETIVNPLDPKLDVISSFSPSSFNSPSSLKGDIAHEYGHFKSFKWMDNSWTQLEGNEWTGLYLERTSVGYENEIKMAGSMHISPRHLGREIKIPKSWMPHTNASGKIWPAGIIPGNPAWANHGVFKIFRTIPKRYLFTKYF